MIRSIRFPARAGVLLPLLALLGVTLWPTRPVRAQETAPIGTFEGQSDVGTVLHAGSGAFDPNTKAYSLSGSGANIWANHDDFHFVWTKMSAENLTLTANIALPGEGGDPHRKAVLMIRQSLDPDSAYADAAIHGNGLASLQFRISKGSPTHEIQANVSGPKRLRIEKVGDRFSLWIAPDGYSLQFAGGSIQLPLQAPFYVGIGVSAHSAEAIQKADFSDVDLNASLPKSAGPVSYSTIQTIDIGSTDSRAIYVTHDRVDLPSWTADAILFQVDEKRYQVPVAGGQAQATEADFPENFGQERSPDGKYVYMTSNRTGTMQIWRQNPDGSDPEQMTRDSSNDGVARLSPDGKQVAYIGYPANLMFLPERADVTIRLLSLADNTVRTMARIFGGRDSVGAQPWSPDSKHLTFVSYQSFP